MFDVWQDGVRMFGDRLLILFFVNAPSDEASCVIVALRNLKQMFFLFPSLRIAAVGLWSFERPLDIASLVGVWVVTLTLYDPIRVFLVTWMQDEATG